jgi:hypothetical protein
MRKQNLAHRGAVSRQPRTRTQTKIDPDLTLPKTANTIYVEDLDTIKNGDTDRERASPSRCRDHLLGCESKLPVGAAAQVFRYRLVHEQRGGPH